MNNNNVAEVIPLKINLNHGFYYLIPLPLKKAVEVGKRVIIPFRNSKKVGIIVSIIESTELQDLKEIEEVLDPVPILSQEILLLADWMAKYYLCPKGIIVSSIIPHRVSTKKITAFFNNGIMAGAISQRERNIYKKQSSENNITIEDNQYNLFPSQSTPITEKKYKPVLFQYHSYRERDLYYIHLIMETIEERLEKLEKKSSIWNKEVLTFLEAKLYTGLSGSCLYKKTSTGQITHYKPTGKQVFFNRIELEAWLMQNRVSTNDELSQQASSYCLKKGELK